MPGTVPSFTDNAARISLSATTVAQVPPIAYAHRGFAPDGAENSTAAFRAAVELGYRHLETDARASLDGVAFAFHDDVLDRVTNHTGRLSRLPAEQIERARIIGRDPIPRLADLLDEFTHAWFNIDVKSAAAIGPVLDALRATNAWHRVRLAAFSHRRLMILRSVAGPHVATALSPQEILQLKSSAARGQSRLPAALSRLAGLDVAAQVPARVGWLDLVDRRFVDWAHGRGLSVDVWTVNRRADMVRLLDLGVDGVMTDRAELLRDVLRERGEWPA
jgi:glycerophosphoryl diester phosphodiesterase